MIYSLSELRDKEVINVENGEKLGYIDDVEFEAEKERIAAFVIYGRKRFGGLFGRENDLIIACRQIELIGNDTVLVRINTRDCERKTKSFRFGIENLLNHTN